MKKFLTSSLSEILDFRLPKWPEVRRFRGRKYLEYELKDGPFYWEFHEHLFSPLRSSWAVSYWRHHLKVSVPTKAHELCTCTGGTFWWTTVIPRLLETPMMISAMIFSLGDVCEIRFCPFQFSFLTRFSNLIESAVKKIPKPPSLRTGRAKWVALLSKCSALWSTRTRRCPPSFCTASPSCVAPMIVQCSCQWDSHGNTFKMSKKKIKKATQNTFIYTFI